MAVLSKIRKRSILVIAVVGIALSAFVIGDVIQSGGFGNSGRYVGSVNGKDISTDQFRFRVANMEQQNQGISRVMVSNSVWGQEVKNVLYQEQFDKLGLRAGKAQIEGTIEQSGNQMFLDEVGKFDQQKFNDYVELLKTQSPQWRMILDDYQQQLENFSREQTYNTLVKAGMYTTNLEGKYQYERDADKVNFDYVMIPYTTINDDQVKVTDQDIVDYMSKRKRQYKGEDSRDFEYVFLQSKASDEDIKEIEEKVASYLKPRTIYNETTKQNETQPGFKEVQDLKDFVNANSDVPFKEEYQFQKNLPITFKDSVGFVSNIYKDNDYIKLSRVVDSRVVADSVKSSHIIIPYQGSERSVSTITKEEAKKQADSIYNIVKDNSAKFAEVANQINTDGTKGNGGDIGWILYSQITYDTFDKDFAEFIFFNPKGSVKVVGTKFGYHIIKIDDVGTRYKAFQLATIAKEIEPSTTTNDQLYVLSQKIEADAQTKSLEELAKENNLNLVPINGITAIEENIQGIGNQRAIVQWAFEKGTKKDDVKRFDIAEGHVIAKLKNVNKLGLQSVERVRAMVEPIIRNERKAALIMEKLQKGTDLEAIAKANNETVRTATGVSLLNPNLVGVGQEVKVVATAVATPANQVSNPIEGKMGVFFVKTQSFVKAPELPSYLMYASRANQQAKNTVSNRIFVSLRDNAEIEDKRIQLGF
ncbi:MAG: peptidylprolyl isomerase [Bacteroidota bacterium]|nr:peptidylprolyl isomerase [Bacteroidota bacterium]